MLTLTVVYFICFDSMGLEIGATSASLLCARVESAGGIVGGNMIINYASLFAGIVFRYEEVIW